MSSLSNLCDTRSIRGPSSVETLLSSPSSLLSPVLSLEAARTQAASREIIPQIGLLYSAAAENLSIRKACEESGASLLQCNYEVAGVDPVELDGEIDRILAAADEGSILPQQIVMAAYQVTPSGEPAHPLLQTLHAYACRVVKESHAILLPGGNSILPKFYGEAFKEGEERHGYNIDPRRTVMEFFLIHECTQTQTPLLCVCRGHQALNIYCGGRLDRSSVGDLQQHKVRTLSWSSEAGRTFSMGEAPKIAYFHHKQTVVHLGSGLRSVARLQMEKDFSSEQEALKAEMDLIRELIEPGDPFGQLPLLESSFKMRQESMHTSLRFLEEERVVIAVESDAHPIIGLQYHPEYLNEERATIEEIEANRLIFKRLVQLAQAKKTLSCVEDTLSPLGK